MAVEKEPMGKVKLRVRESALTMQEFTLEEMVRATGLNKVSVESELKRMRQSGLITAHNVKRPQPGRPRCIYRLTSDPEKRFKLSSQVAEFYPKPAPQARPTSRHYFNAVELLDNLGASEKAEESARTLRECEEELNFAWYEEGSSDEILEAFIRSQKGRVEYLKGNYEQAQALFGEARETFTSFDLPEEKAWVGEHWLASRVQHRWKEEPGSTLLDKARSMIAELVGLGITSSTQHPMTVLLLDMTKQLVAALAKPARAMVLEDSNYMVREAALNKLWNVVDVPSDHIVSRAGSALKNKQQAGPQTHYSEAPSASSAWKHHLSDEYSYGQSSGDDLITALNSPSRNMSAATAAAAATTMFGPQTWWLRGHGKD